MEAKKVADIATCAGEILMSNGAEAYRVEETIKKICSSYGYLGECISTTTGVYISISDKDGELITSVKRIKQRRVDLYRVELINSFSRNLIDCPLSYEEAKRSLQNIYNAPNFSLRVRVAAACLTAFVYTLFFSGTVVDGLISAVISFGIYLMMEKLSEIGSFEFLDHFLAGFFIGAFSTLVQLALPEINKGNVITGAIIVLLPGVALTNGIKDLLFGDFVSGMAKFGEAILIIVAMGAGIAASLSLLMNWIS